jgi:hypothetical protein
MPAEEPILVLSQDYELFFQRSGSAEKCLFEPCAALLAFAEQHGVSFTFYVDVGMLACMERYADQSHDLRREHTHISRHIEMLSSKGHDIALHIHPHWEDSRWQNGQWDFSNSRYQLAFFSADEIAEIVRSYAGRLGQICGKAPSSYRAGGFCVEPFDLLRPGLMEAGITVDSSIVPGADLKDPEKGFDFSAAPDVAWWNFRTGPTQEDADGDFLEIPVTPQKLPLMFYWGRLVERLLGPVTSNRFGDGTSKAIGRKEIIRRLAGQSRVAELSIDDAKAQHLMAARNRGARRDVWHLMGHPKLVSMESLSVLERFIEAKSIRRFATVDVLARMIRAGESPRSP